ncbi:AAA family ATPase [Kineococcus arenarius]|uniref:AAA family ATPase n=1 Tax=unclassified Kineococcus TaxID=2621656 RepID=UPI003D7DED70
MGLQNQVFAWAAAAAVAERALFKPIVTGWVVRVGAQTGFAVDDVAVQTDSGAWALFQAKAGLGLGKAEDSPLADAFDQAVEQYLRGSVPDGTAGQRSVDPTRDAIVLCTDSAAPASVRIHLAKALERTGEQPTGTPLGHELTADEAKAINVALAHVRRYWTADGRAAATDEELRSVCRLVKVVVVDGDDGDQDRATAIAELRAVVSADQADKAWSVLLEQAQDASTNREWRDRSRLADALVRAGVDVAPEAQFAADVARLTAASTANLTAFARAAQLPTSGGLHLSRAVVKEIPDAPGTGGLLIVGGAGCGKSAVAHAVAVARGQTSHVLLLRAEEVAGVNRLQLKEPLTNVLRGWSGPPSTLVIDGVDALRGSEDRDVVGRLVDSLNGTRWEVVATVRAFDARHSPSLQKAFHGVPLCTRPEHSDPQLPGVRHIEVQDLNDDELAAVNSSTPLGQVVRDAGPDLLALLRNPFNLSLAAELLDAPGPGARADLSATRTRTGLLRAYWQWRVRDEDATAREALLARLAALMTSMRSLKATEAEPVVLATDNTALAALLSRNVLRAADGAFPGSRRVLTFAHNILFDYAVALYVLEVGSDGEGLVEVLDQDPSLPLVARPSLDLLADALWEHRDEAPFWSVCLAVAASEHSLASLAFAGRLARLATKRGDLQALTVPTTAPGSASGRLGGARTMIRHLAGAVRASSLLSDQEVAGAAPALAEVAVALAGRAAKSCAEAALLLDLLKALDQRLSADPTGPAAARRAEAAVALLDACRADPAQYERLAAQTLRLVTQFAASDHDSVDAIRRLLDDNPALQQWGGTVLSRLPDAAIALAATDPALARRTAFAVVSFTETRDEVVHFGGPQLPLTESRSQQSDRGVFRLARAFPKLCALDLTTASAVFCDFVAAFDPPTADPVHARADWPVDVDGAAGWLQDGRDLSMIGPHQTAHTAAAALADALVAAPDDMSTAAVVVLVEGLRSAAAWGGLMSACSDPTGLGAVLLPALASGALLAHFDSREGAARMLKALADSRITPPAVLDRLVEAAADTASRNGMSDWGADELVGCLRPDDVAAPDLLARLDRLGSAGPPPVTPRRRITAMTMPWSWLDGLKDEGVEIPPETEAAARALDAEMSARRDQAQAPDGDSLSAAFSTAAAAFAADPDLHDRFRHQLADAAALLAADSDAATGTPLGAAVLDVLLDSAASAEAGGFV